MKLEWNAFSFISAQSGRIKVPESKPCVAESQIRKELHNQGRGGEQKEGFRRQLCLRIGSEPGPSMCVLTSEGERMIIGKPAVVIERIPAGTRDGVCGSEPAINQLRALGWNHWGLLSFLLCKVNKHLFPRPA